MKGGRQALKTVRPLSVGGTGPLLLPQHSKFMPYHKTAVRRRGDGRHLHSDCFSRPNTASGLIFTLLFLGASMVPQAKALPWSWLEIDSFNTTAFRTTAMAHLPDGRFLYGVSGQLHLQDAFGLAAKTTISTAAILPQVLDPSLIAVKNADHALVGQGGFGAVSSVFSFDPTPPTPGPANPPLASPQNYAGVYWKSPTSALEGWLIGGGNGDLSANNVIFVSLDGSKSGPVTGAISTFSGGIAVDADGNLYAATYEIDFDTFQPTADADRVLKFSAPLVEAAIQAVIAGSPAPVSISSSTFVYKFDGTSSIAVDSTGRIWATGYAVNHLQVFDPVTQSMTRIVPDHGSFPGGTDILYTVRDFMRSGTGYVAFLAQDEYGNSGTKVYKGWLPCSAVVIPRIEQWRAQQFGVHNLTLATQSAMWGPSADPDRDGVVNLLEYAAGTSPNFADASPVSCNAQAGALRFSFIRDPLNTDLTYVVEVSGSLSGGSWQEIARSTGGAITVSSGAGAAGISEVPEGSRIRVSVLDPVAGASRFARLRVVLNLP